MIGTLFSLGFNHCSISFGIHWFKQTPFISLYNGWNMQEIYILCSLNVRFFYTTVGFCWEIFPLLNHELGISCFLQRWRIVNTSCSSDEAAKSQLSHREVIYIHLNVNFESLKYLLKYDVPLVIELIWGDSTLFCRYPDVIISFFAQNQFCYFNIYIYICCSIIFVSK